MQQTDTESYKKELDELIKWCRVFIMDELVFHNGKTLTPELIGTITGNVVKSLEGK